jgi:hypothetical protein
MTSPEIELDKALLLDTTAFWHMKKTEHDVDKLRAALPKEVQNALMLLDRLDTVTADLIYAITVHLNKEKEAGRPWPFRASRDQARECIKAAKELLREINLAQTVDAHGERLDQQEVIVGKYGAQLADHEVRSSASAIAVPSIGDGSRRRRPPRHRPPSTRH